MLQQILLPKIHSEKPHNEERHQAFNEGPNVENKRNSSLRRAFFAIGTFRETYYDDNDKYLFWSFRFQMYNK